MKTYHYTEHTSPFHHTKAKRESWFSITLLDATLILGFALVFVAVVFQSGLV